MLKEVKCIKVHNDNFVGSKHEVIKEKPLSIYVNGRHFSTAMITPQMKEEFVIGHLFSEGVIKGVKEIESLQIEGNIAKMIINGPLPLRVLAVKKHIVSGCSGVSSFLDESKLPKISSVLQINATDVFSKVKTISDSKAHKITGGVHIVGLFDKEGTISISEDIGRHNALDKVIGYGLTKNVYFKETFVACTGRISSEMAMKCALGNIPVIASRGATTSLAIEIAEKTGLTIIGFVRGEKMNIYTNEERIVVKK